jgi:hypothetical protein
MSLARNLARLFPNASGLLPNANIEAMAASKLTGQVPDANAPSGSVIQVVQSISTASFSNSTTSMADANYCAVSQASRDNNSGFAAFVAHGLADSQTTTSCRVVNGYDGGAFDIPRCNVAIFR